jgi:hypothetical protein
MQPLIELVHVSEHEWLVADEGSLLGVVEEHHGDFEAVIGDGPAWHPHFDSLGAATDYFTEYASALHLGSS